MDYYLKMGYITSDEYYAKLENMRDKYLETDTDEWRSVNVELKKYYDSLTENQKKAYEQQARKTFIFFNFFLFFLDCRFSLCNFIINIRYCFICFLSCVFSRRQL